MQILWSSLNPGSCITNKGEVTVVLTHANVNIIPHRARILVQVTINRRLLIGRDGHLDQSEAYDLS